MDLHRWKDGSSFLFTFVNQTSVTMINNSEFADRLLKIMEYNQLSASAFADRIHVQRSSISHLLSGRNKPSLDFVMKVIKEFEEVELYWLLNGKGSYPATGPAKKILSNSMAPAPTSENRENSEVRTQAETPVSKSTATEKETQAEPHDRAIERIVVFYSDGTFKAYLP